MPTPLALASTLLGTLSILSWLFAQLPQIVKNYRLGSTSGLSAFFLIEWCLGDMSNLFGALLTNQATWQVIIGAYYCLVDIMLVGQWVWYEALEHGRPLKKIWLSKTRSRTGEDMNGNGGPAGARRLMEAVEPIQGPVLVEQEEDVSLPKSVDGQLDTSSPQDIPLPKSGSASSMFHTPIYGFLSPSTTAPGTPQSNAAAAQSMQRVQHRQRYSQNLPAPSPRAFFFTTTILTLASCTVIAPANASPLLGTSDTESSALLPSLGTTLSWASTLLYLGSRLPQLILNTRRRSTAGLSPALFLAAFCGNFFYSASLLLNPLAWESYDPFGGHGWVGPEGSEQAEWVKAALPFFLGAAGVLAMDGAVGIQFWLYSNAHAAAAGEGAVEEVLMVNADEQKEGGRGNRKRWRVKRVSGWMRGWQPGVSGRISPVLGRREAEVGNPEVARLFQPQAHRGQGGRSYGAA